MAKSSTPSYTVKRRIYPEPWQADIINRKMDLGNRMYNNAVRHYKSVVEELRQDLWFIRNLEAWKACGEDAPGKKTSQTRYPHASAPTGSMNMISMPTWRGEKYFQSQRAWDQHHSETWHCPVPFCQEGCFLRHGDPFPAAWVYGYPGRKSSPQRDHL